MGCGNNSVSRSYLTSQPITTPSPRATKASVADLGAQILRLAAQEMKANADRAEKARKARAGEVKAAAAAAKRAAAREDADKKAKGEEEGRTRGDGPSLPSNYRTSDRRRDVRQACRSGLFVFGQPEDAGVQEGQIQILPSYVLKIDEAGNLKAR